LGPKDFKRAQQFQRSGVGTCELVRDVGPLAR
jgi:hypothetical protein